MSVCSKCGNQVPEDMIFCGLCGTAVENKPAYIPVAQEPAYTVVAPRVPGGVKAQGFIGMGLSIRGLYSGVIGMPIVLLLEVCAMLYIWFGLAIVPSFYALLYAFVFCTISLPPSIVGMVLCAQSRKRGNPSRACTAGRRLALSSIIVNAVMIVLAIAMFLLSILALVFLLYATAYSGY